MNKTQMDYFLKLLNFYDNEGQDKLLEDIFKNVKEQKEKGALTNAQIDGFVKNISPMINAVQREKLAALVARLYEI